MVSEEPATGGDGAFASLTNGASGGVRLECGFDLRGGDDVHVGDTLSVDVALASGSDLGEKSGQVVSYSENGPSCGDTCRSANVELD